MKFTKKRTPVSKIFLSEAADNNIRYSIIQHIILILDFLIEALHICLVNEQNNENIHGCEIQGQMADYETSFKKFCDFGEIVMKFG